MFEPNTIKTLLSMKREKNGSEKDSPPTNIVSKTVDATAMATNIGFATIQESMDLNNEMDNFLKEHEKWKSEYAEKQKILNSKIAKPIEKPTESQKTENFTNIWLAKESLESAKKCDANAKELENKKTKFQDVQSKKAEIDKKIELSQKAFENKAAVQKLVSPLDELESQLKFEDEELSEILKSQKDKKNYGKNEEIKKNEENKTDDPKVAKLLKDLDADMKELDELLK